MSVVLYRVSVIGIDADTLEPATKKWIEYFLDAPSAREAFDEHCQDDDPEIINTEVSLEEVVVERSSIEAFSEVDDDLVPVLLLRLSQPIILDVSAVDRWQLDEETIKARIERLKQLLAQANAVHKRLNTH